MIKIEKLMDGAKATFIRTELRQPIFVGQLISHAELATLEVVGGSVMYSIDESEVVTVQGTVVAPPAPPTEIPPPTSTKPITPTKVIKQPKK